MGIYPAVGTWQGHYGIYGVSLSQSHDSIKVWESHNITTPVKAAFIALTTRLAELAELPEGLKPKEERIRWLF